MRRWLSLTLLQGAVWTRQRLHAQGVRGDRRAVVPHGGATGRHLDRHISEVWNHLDTGDWRASPTLRVVTDVQCVGACLASRGWCGFHFRRVQGRPAGEVSVSGDVVHDDATDATGQGRWGLEGIHEDWTGLLKSFCFASGIDKSSCLPWNLQDPKKIASFLFKCNSVTYTERLKSPRIIKTHLPMTLLPPNLMDVAKGDSHSSAGCS